MGTPRKPTAMKILNGSARNDPGKLNAAEPLPELGGRSPSWLPKKGVAWSTWCRYLPMLKKIRVMTQADCDAFALGCMALEEYLSLREQDRDWRRMHSAANRYLTVLREFGMTPASRTKVVVIPKDTTTDPVERWLAAR